MKKRCSGAEELQKANGTGSCISLFTVDWQVVSVDCLSALWHYSPISAGFRNDLKNIWGVEKKMRPLILFLRWKNLKNRGWSGHLEEWDHSVNVRGRQQQYKHNKQMSHSVWFYIILAIWIHSSVYMCMACVRACSCVCVCVVQLLHKFKQNLLIYPFITHILNSHIHVICVSTGVVGICGLNMIGQSGLISRALFLLYQSAAAKISEITGGYFSCNSYTHDIGVSPGWMLSRHYPQRLLYHYPAAIRAESWWLQTPIKKRLTQHHTSFKISPPQFMQGGCFSWGMLSGNRGYRITNLQFSKTVLSVSHTGPVLTILLLDKLIWATGCQPRWCNFSQRVDTQDLRPEGPHRHTI